MQHANAAKIASMKETMERMSLEEAELNGKMIASSYIKGGWHIV